MPKNSMHKPNRQIRTRRLVLLALAAITASGCALDRLPRIDPTGQRLLLFPDEPTPTISPLPQSAAPTLNPAVASNLPATTPNVVAPPVFTDPFLPGGAGTATTDLLGQPVLVGPPVATTAGQAMPGTLVALAPQGEALSISPSRVLAPVGSEVILVGGVCTESGYLRTNDRIEWMLDRAGTGQIVTVGGRGELDILRLPQNTPRKIDNYFAIGATSPYAECLDRGTPDPSDDVQIRRGDAWITVSSPTEGTSYVTAYAPNVPNWGGRTARATIYWIDAQWAFPPSVTLSPGESHTLTTTITRQSDGAPIAGWIVRYRVAGGSAGLGYEQGQTSEVATNNQGRASVEITPTDNRPGTTNIEIEIVRPEQAGAAASPRVTLGTGITSITWAAGGITGTPMPTTPPPVLPPTDAAPVAPPVDSWQSPTPAPTPQPAPPAGRPDLVVRIEQRSSGPFRVGSQVEYLVTVVNQGDGTARNVKIVDEFDPGLENDAAAPGEQFIKSDTPFDLEPGASQALPLVFRVTQPGRLSHSVTVTADNAVTASDRAFLTAEGSGVGGGALAEPTLRVTMDGPLRSNVGDTAQFKIKVENIGTTPATNVAVVNDRDPELVPVGDIRPFDQDLYLRTGQIRWTIERIAPGGSEEFQLACECRQPAQSSCNRVEVTADGLSAAKFDQRCLEIRPQFDGGGVIAPPLGGTPPVAPPQGGGLDITITETKTPARVNERFLIFVGVRNNTGTSQQNVQLRVLIPPVLQGDYGQVSSPAPAQTAPWGEYGTALLVGPIPEIAAGADYRVTIPVDAVQQGPGKVIAESSSATLAPQAVERDIQVLPR